MKNLLKNHKYILIFCLFFIVACTSTKTKSTDYAARGEMYLKTGKLAKAEKYLNKAIEANPYNIDAYKNRGSLYYNLGDFENALKDFDYALQYEPNNSSILSAKAAVLASMGQYEESFNNLLTALKLNPSNIAALNSMAGIYFIIGDFEKAVQIYTISLEYQTTPEAYLMRGKCYLELGKKEEAENDLAMAKILKHGTGNTAPSDAANK